MKTWIWVVIVLVVLVGGWYWYSSQGTGSAPVTEEAGVQQDAGAVQQEVVVQ